MISNEHILALIERLESDLAALKRAIQTDATDAEDDDVRRRVEERAAAWRRAKGGAR